MPGNQPEIVTVPRAGWPLRSGGAGIPTRRAGLSRAVGVLYAVAPPSRHAELEAPPDRGLFEYVVPPLEGASGGRRHSGRGLFGQEPL